MNSSPLAAIWHWYPLLAWVACARFCSLPLGSLSYLNFYLKLRLDSNFSYGTGLHQDEFVHAVARGGRLRPHRGRDHHREAFHAPRPLLILYLQEVLIGDDLNKPVAQNAVRHP